MPWSLDTVTPPRAETFYWATIMVSQTLGTALGEFLADTGGLRCNGGTLLFSRLPARGAAPPGPADPPRQGCRSGAGPG